MKSGFVIIAVGALLVCSIVVMVSGLCAGTIDYRQEMRFFVQAISTYAKKQKPNFIVIPQNGVELVSTTGDIAGLPDRDYLNAIDGIGQESLFYGYYADGKKSPKSETRRISALLDMAKAEGKVAILVSDYCLTQSCMIDSMHKNKAKGYLSFSAEHRELNNIPNYSAAIYNKNSKSIKKLSEASNFLYLINPESFSTRQKLVDAVAGTDFDLVILDFFFKGEEFTKAQVEQLKAKNHGGDRLVISYMSIGEAEDYRYYWTEQWKVKPPEWLKEENPDWSHNYKVEYWNPEWQHIIYGSDSSYLDKILAGGFDGVYLDIIDAFEFFESEKAGE